MSLAIAILILVGTTGIAVVAMLRVRRTAPDGSYFNDGDRAAGVFGVIATGFAVLLGFVVFLAFTSYDSARTGAETGAHIVAQQVETAQLFPPAASRTLTAELVCYARSVIGVQWDRMEAGTLGDDLNPWAVRMFHTLKGVDPESPTEQAAYAKWLDERSAREDARNDRVHGAAGVIPTPLWIVLFFISAVIVFYMFFFADSAERAVVQAVLMGSIVAVIVSMLLLLQFLNDPFHGGLGGLRPDEMKRTLKIIDQELSVDERHLRLPCDTRGNAR